jgi:hypothetical protein
VVAIMNVKVVAPARLDRASGQSRLEYFPGIANPSRLAILFMLENMHRVGILIAEPPKDGAGTHRQGNLAAAIRFGVCGEQPHNSAVALPYDPVPV